MKEAMGFVYTMHKGKKTVHAAMRNSHGQVSRFQKNGKGVWCGKKVASTFFEHTWENVSREQIEAKIEVIAEYDRLMPVRKFRYDYLDQYSCLMCGAIIFDRTLHMRWHRQAGFSETLVALFGEGE